MRALVTGGMGFVGRHLARYLVSCGDTVALTYLPPNSPSLVPPSSVLGSVEGAPPVIEESSVELPRTVQSFALDVTDRAAVSQLISILKPDVIYHLAAFTFVPDGEKKSELVFAVNTFGTQAILDALVEHSPDTRFLYVSSAEIYGDPRPGTMPLTELAELRPVNIYGVAKAAADLMTYKYHVRNGLHTVRVRPFPHLGPGQSSAFAISGFAKQVAEIKLGKRAPIILVGNLEAKRDYSDVLDIVRGYREALLNGKPGDVYNFASGEGIGVGEMLQKLITRAGIQAEIQVDPARIRPVDVAELTGSSAKAQRDFGWKPKVDREASLDALLAYWLEECGSAK